MTTWKVSFSQPVNIHVDVDNVEKSPSKESILKKLEESNLPRYDKLRARTCLHSLTVPWIVTDNSPVYFHSNHPDLGNVSITVKKA